MIDEAPNRNQLLEMLGPGPVAEMIATVPERQTSPAATEKAEPVPAAKAADPDRDALLKAMEAGLPMDAVIPTAEPAAKPEDAKPTEATPAKVDTRPEDAPLSREDIAAERARLKSEAEQLAAQKAEWEKTINDATSQISAVNRTAEDWAAMAKEWRAEGRDDLADTAMQRAEGLRRDAAKLAETAKASQDKAQFENRQKAAMAKVISENPELRTEGSQLAKDAYAIMTKHQLLAQIPDGIAYAVEAAKLTRQAARVGDLEKELATVKQRLADRERLLQPGTGGPSAASDLSGFDNLPRAQQRETLMEALRRADQAG